MPMKKDHKRPHWDLLKGFKMCHALISLFSSHQSLILVSRMEPAPNPSPLHILKCWNLTCSHSHNCRRSTDESIESGEEDSLKSSQHVWPSGWMFLSTCLRCSLEFFVHLRTTIFILFMSEQQLGRKLYFTYFRDQLRIAHSHSLSHSLLSLFSPGPWLKNS